MNGYVMALLLAAGLCASCATQREVGDAPQPEWLEALIADLANQPVANPPALVARYEYRGQTVYYVPSRCCDIPSTVYDADGAIICHADGGLAGDGDGRCGDFFQVRMDEGIIWRDPRGGS